MQAVSRLHFLVLVGKQENSFCGIQMDVFIILSYHLFLL